MVATALTATLEVAGYKGTVGTVQSQKYSSTKSWMLYLYKTGMCIVV